MSQSSLLFAALLSLASVTHAQEGTSSDLEITKKFFNAAISNQNSAEDIEALKTSLSSLSNQSSADEIAFIEKYTGTMKGREYPEIEQTLLTNLGSGFSGSSENVKLIMAYAKFRVLSPDSKWFRTEGIPNRLNSFSIDHSKTSPRSTAPPSSTKPASSDTCNPGANLGKELEEFVTEAGNIEAAKKKASIESLRLVNPVLRDSVGAAVFNLKPGEVMICSREDGCRLAANPSKMDKASRYDEVVIHHAAGPLNQSAANIQAYHLRPEAEGGPKDGPWGDVGYHFVIAEDPKTNEWRVYQGRELKYEGAHIEGTKDRHKIGVVVAGNFDEETPPPEALQLLTNLIAELSNPESKTCTGAKCENISVVVSKISGHCDHQQKACPGKNLLQGVRALDLKFGEGSRKLKLYQSVIDYDPKTRPSN